MTDQPVFHPYEPPTEDDSTSSAVTLLIGIAALILLAISPALVILVWKAAL